MRDILLTLILVGLLPISFKRPYIGALIFALISLANPHRMTWGFAYSMPWAMAYAGVTILGLLATQERQIADSIKRYSPVLLYLAWMAVTSIFALEPGEARARWIEVAKVHTMCLVTLALLTDWNKVRLLVWVCSCSVGFYGLKGGVFTLMSGGQFLVWGPLDSAIQDNNHLAVGLVMTLPMMYWLYTDAKKRWLRWLIAFSALMSAVSVFGSHSRSAFLGIAAMSFFLLMKSQHKFAVGIVTVLTAIGLASFMPQDYWDRMQTIKTYEEDASALGRINSWTAGFNVANDRITGAGFQWYTPRNFARYAPRPEAVHASHSIYFQALGEHGWPGLVMFIWIWAVVWLNCRRAIRRAEQNNEGRSKALLARMIQVSLIGYAVGGAFVNIGNWDFIYYLAVSAFAAARLVADASTLTKFKLAVAQ
ncbi:putative O-glycosylation ligase, exosortase A system-associated [Zeimonas arvi]|uniref:Putative O-glycosylation ligase, exosortase A system-associated n=1 Tax=Zeimonas arvi TaxID=2498847 RepID=A0A5C8NXV3_9BURK|nr:putative O-glycosylation ligase, exosortase A system-associated [Zeimonas arvi]TXL65950.1 putative O-glycosylation ligase, exosortase A system-associated [Zeimonas arvi]